MPVQRARLARTKHGLSPDGPGWFVVNARDSVWWGTERFGASTSFESPKHRFAQYGVNIQVLRKGQPNCHYHGESDQEDFLVVSGRCLVLIEGREIPLGPWDFVHCAPLTEHVFVGTSREPCVIVMMGGRSPGGRIRYPVSALALKHKAGVTRATRKPRVSYAGISWAPVPPPAPFGKRARRKK